MFLLRPTVRRTEAEREPDGRVQCVFSFFFDVGDSFVDVGDSPARVDGTVERARRNPG